ncbi:MAG: hypothetical protein HN731_17065 [Rhodospirillaceae bacterium]|nr:hypothetical protein [Rhodospirillaceae bacterium]
MRAKLFSIVSAFTFIFLTTSANAAPQILGLVATAQPVPLTCIDGICKAEITTVCLQEYRRAPMPGRAYKAGQGAQISLNVMGQDGVTKSFAVAEKISLTARRHYTSVVVSLPESSLRKFGHKNKARASISVGAMASVIPLPKASDKAPLSSLEIEQYIGPLRQIARNTFATDRVRMQTTSHLSQVINRLPDDLADDQVAFEKNWTKLSNDKSRRLTPKARAKVSQIAEVCREDYKVGKAATMRACLEQQHDYLAAETNKKVWQAMKPGG